MKEWSDMFAEILPQAKQLEGNFLRNKGLGGDLHEKVYLTKPQPSPEPPSLHTEAEALRE